MLNIRKASKSDIDLLIKLRFDYINTDFDRLNPEEEDKIKKQLNEYFPKHFDYGDFIAVIAEFDGKIAGTAFMVINERPANTGFITGKTADIYNVLTYPEYRRQGIATKLMEVLIDEAKKANASFIELSASSMGKSVYEKVGFTEKSHSKFTEMRLKLI